MKTIRTHDKFYLHEDRHNEPKEMFKFIIKVLFSEDELSNNYKICDFGCSNGEFLYYLSKISNFDLNGVDILPELIKKTKTILPNSNLKIGSILEKNIYSENSFDFSFITGVHMIFDDFEKLFENLFYWTKEEGKVIITGLFNPYPLDVYIKYKESTNYESDYFESGWNIFSIESVSNFLKSKNIFDFEFKKFEIKKELSQKNDFVRSWTFKDIDEKLIITNGLNILQNHYSLILKI